MPLHAMFHDIEFYSIARFRLNTKPFSYLSHRFYIFSISILIYRLESSFAVTKLFFDSFSLTEVLHLFYFKLSTLRTFILLDIRDNSKARRAVNSNIENQAAVSIQSMVRGVFGRALFFKIPHVRAFYENLLVRTSSCTEQQVDGMLDLTMRKNNDNTARKISDISQGKIDHRESRDRVEEVGGTYDDELKEEEREKYNDSSALKKSMSRRRENGKRYYDSSSSDEDDDDSVINKSNMQVREGCQLDKNDALDEKKFLNNQDEHPNNFQKSQRTLFEFQNKSSGHPGYYPLGDSLLLMSSYMTDDSHPTIFLRWYMEITFSSLPNSSKSGRKALLQVINSTNIKESNRDNGGSNVLHDAKVDNMTIRSTISYPFSMLNFTETLLTSQIRDFHLCSDITVSVFILPDNCSPDNDDLEKDVNVKNIPQKQNNVQDSQSLHFENSEINKTTAMKNLSFSPNKSSDSDFNYNFNDDNSKDDANSSNCTTSSSMENLKINKTQEILDPSFKGKMSFQHGEIGPFGGRVFIVLHPNIIQLKRLHQSMGITSLFQSVRPLHVMGTIINMAMPSNQYLRLARTVESYNMISGEILEPKQVKNKFEKM